MQEVCKCQPKTSDWLKKLFQFFSVFFRWSTRKSLPPWLSRNWVFSIELWWSSVPENLHPFQNSDKTYRCYHSLPNVQTPNDTQQKDWTGILLVHDFVSLMQKHFIYIRVLMTFALKLGAPKPHQYTSMDTSYFLLTVVWQIDFCPIVAAST